MTLSSAAMTELGQTVVCKTSANYLSWIVETAQVGKIGGFYQVVLENEHHLFAQFFLYPRGLDRDILTGETVVSFDPSLPFKVIPVETIKLKTYIYPQALLWYHQNGFRRALTPNIWENSDEPSQRYCLIGEALE